MESSSICNASSRLYCASWSYREPSIKGTQVRPPTSYRVRVHDKGSADIGTIRFVAQPKSHQKDALVCDIVIARFNCISQIVSRFAGSRNDDGWITKFDHLPIDLKYASAGKAPNISYGIRNTHIIQSLSLVPDFHVRTFGRASVAWS